MSEEAVLTLIGLLIGALFTVIGFIIRGMWAKLAKLEEGAGELAAFIARFNATERDWERWREAEARETGIRRDGVDKRLDAHSIDLKDHGTRLTRLERNGGPYQK